MILLLVSAQITLRVKGILALITWEAGAAGEQVGEQSTSEGETCRRLLLIQRLERRRRCTGGTWMSLFFVCSQGLWIAKRGLAHGTNISDAAVLGLLVLLQITWRLGRKAALSTGEAGGRHCIAGALNLALVTTHPHSLQIKHFIIATIKGTVIQILHISSTKFNLSTKIITKSDHNDVFLLGAPV